MTKLQITIFDAITGENLQRDMTDDEILAHKEQLKITANEQKQKEIETKAKAQAKATAEGKLAALGLTTDDLRALGL
jgi:hypothetical protein